MKEPVFRIGQIFGELTIVAVDTEHSKTTTYYNCSCSCGGSRLVREDRFKIYHNCGNPIHKADEVKERVYNSLILSDDISLRSSHTIDDKYNAKSFEFIFDCNVCEFTFTVKSSSYWKRQINCPCCSSSPIRECDLENFTSSLGYSIVDVIRDDENNRLLKLVCNKGHERLSGLQYLKIQPKCTTCYPPKNKVKDFTDIDKIVTQKGFKLLSIDKSSKLIKVVVKCQNGHEWSPFLSNFQREERNCPYCNRGEVKDLFFYLQKVTDPRTGNTYCKYGITKNWPDLRVNRQAASSKMRHELTDFAWLRKDVVVELESFLKKTICHVDFGYKFDGYTETVPSEYEDFLRMFIVNAVSYDGNMEEYLERISSRCR